MDIKTFLNKKPYLIAGPCSAESEKQVLSIAKKIVKSVDLFRAGIWKPRTKPSSFEGAGKKALQWMKKVRKETGMKVITEVATAKHVEMCLEAGIDALWIGARTTVNPFYVQEIAEALSGENIPIFVKNPIHPEIGLWVGALERLYNKGTTNLAAIHRGFFTYESSKYRNDPKWEIPIELRRNIPDLPIICDSSHIAGKNDLIEGVSQIAMDLDMNGLMIETHNKPTAALSDSKQQVTPDELNNILANLVFRKRRFENKHLSFELTKLRVEIDKLDKDIVESLHQRKDLVEKIAKFKLKNEITIFQIERWLQILKNRQEQASETGLDPNMISDIFELIHKYSILTQTKIMKQ